MDVRMQFLRFQLMLTMPDNQGMFAQILTMSSFIDAVNIARPPYNSAYISDMT